MGQVTEFLKKYKIVLIGLLVVVLIYTGFNFLKGDSSSELALDYSPGAQGYDISVGQSILRTLSELQGIKLKITIFEDPVFRSLSERQVSTTTEPLGRIDPFAPVEEGDDEASD